MEISIEGGNKMNAYLENLLEKIGGEGLHARIGFLEGSTCGADNSTPAPEVAFWNEFGTPGAENPIPPRPFMRTTVQMKSPTWGSLIAAALRISDNEGRKALMIAGLKIKQQIQKQITDTTDPPNAPSTVKAKGFNKPLEHSKNMKRAVNFEVTAKPTEGGS